MSKLATKSAMKRAKSIALDGDAMRPDGGDMLAQTINLPMGEAPRGEHWRVMTGNANYNLWARVAYRYEAKE